MDVFSLTVAFLIGTATGAAGSYMADKYTDKRRDAKRLKEKKELWRDIERRFPAVIAEMRSDFSSDAGRNIRAFFVKPSNTMIGFHTEPWLEFHTDKHADLIPAVLYLEKHGFVSDITPGNTPLYRVQEGLIDQLVRK